MNRICWTAFSLIWLALPPVCTAADVRTTQLTVTAGKSLVLDTPADLRRVSVTNGDLAEAVAVSPREVLINGKAAGETSVVVWQQDGTRVLYDLAVRPSMLRANAVRRQFEQELAGQTVTLEIDNDNVFLRGRVKDLYSAGRAVSMASTLGRVINLLQVDTPPAQAEILLKVRFADVDRKAGSDLGINLLSTGAGHTIGQTTTGQFAPATPQVQNGAVQWTFADALNIFLFRPDLNLGALIKALESRNVLEMLAEPNVLAVDGKPASFVSGGEFPFPVVQGGATAGAVTIQFREYGVRIDFLPIVTPRGSIRLQVTPEVSSLDFSNALQFQGYTIPALATRRVHTEVELEDGQSFLIAGLLDQSMTETINRIPGLGNIPLLGKLFQSHSRSQNNSELLVIVTPQLVRPIPAGATLPEVKMPRSLWDGGPLHVPQHPGSTVTGLVPLPPVRETLPVEELVERARQLQAIDPAQAGSPAPSGAGTSPGLGGGK